VNATVRKVLVRLFVSGAALGLSFWLLASVFDGLDVEAVFDSLREISDAERLALLGAFVIDLAAQGLMTASLVPGLPVRRGVLAFVGPSSVASVIPGPSDLPVRIRMFQSWGRSASESALAVTANGIFSIGSKLVLPVLAGVVVVVIDFPSEGLGRTIAIAAMVLFMAVAALAFTLSSDRRVRAAGALLDGPWRFTLRLVRRQSGAPLADQLAGLRVQALSLLRSQWRIATWAAFLTSATRLAMLIMAVRFAGVPQDVLPWPAIFVAYAVVAGLTAVPITAGNVGVSETAFIGLLTAVSGSEWVNEVTAGVLIFRLLTWIFIIPTGLAALGIWKYGQRRAAVAAAAAASDVHDDR
jgi:hypothetical protein